MKSVQLEKRYVQSFPAERPAIRRKVGVYIQEHEAWPDRHVGRDVFLGHLRYLDILDPLSAGQSSHRQSWSQYFQATSGVILVIDSTDRARMDLVRQELHKMMADDASPIYISLTFRN